MKTNPLLDKNDKRNYSLMDMSFSTMNSNRKPKPKNRKTPAILGLLSFFGAAFAIIWPCLKLITTSDNQGPPALLLFVGCLSLLYLFVHALDDECEDE